MVRIGKQARLVRTCRHCGGRFAPADIRAAEQRYCSAACRSVARHGPCFGCDDTAHEIRATYGVPLCHRCKTVVFKTCWRKVRHASEAAALAMAPDRAPYAYDCLVCPYYHATSQPPAPSNPEHAPWIARATELGRRLQAVGFDIDTARGWTNAGPRVAP